MSILSQRVFILDRGSKYYKGLVIESSFSDFKILKIQKLKVIYDLDFFQEESFNDDSLPEFEYNFLRFHKTFFSEEENLIFLFNNNEVYFRDLEIPAEKEEVVFDILENEIEAYLPLKLEEVQVLGSIHNFHQGEAKVLGVAVQNKKLEDYTNIIIENNVNIKMIGVEAFALASAIELIPENDYKSKILAQLDIGYTKTTLNILKERKLINVRTIPFGVKNLVDILKSQLKDKKDDDYYESLLFSSFLEIFNNTSEKYTNISGEIQDEINYLSSELQRTFYSSNIENVSFILVSGGGVLINGLIDELEKKLNVPIQRYPVRIENDNIEPYIIALGAYFEFKKKNKIDFLKTSLGLNIRKNELEFRFFFLPSIIVGISVIILLLSYILGIVLERRQLQFFQDQIREVVTSIPEVGNAPNPVSKAKVNCQKRIDSWKSIVSNIKTLDILKEVDQHIVSPSVSKVEFKSLRYTEEQVELELVVDSIANVVKVQEELQKSRMFSSVEVVRRDLIAGQKVRLQLNLKIKPSDIKLDLSCK